MKKASSIGLIILVLLLAGCGAGENWIVEFTKPLQFINGKESTFEIKVTEEKKPVTDLNATAEIEMVTMSHGTINLKLEEDKDGLYIGKTMLSMPGDYLVSFKFKKDGYTVEKTQEIEVGEAEAGAQD